MTIRRLLISVIAVVSVWTPLSVAPAAAAAPLTAIFAPTDDATVRADQPTRNFGSAPALEVDGRPVKNALLKFDVSGVGPGTVISARLRLFCQDSSSVGGTLAPSTVAWTEATVTWATAPTAGSPIAALGKVTAGSWYEIDLTSLVRGDGTVSLVLASPATNGADYASKEAGLALAPQLVVTYQVVDPDGQPPTQPPGLVGSAVSSNEVDLSWQPSTDDVAVAGYDVMRNSTLAASTTDTHYVDTGVAGGTTYTYAVRARDAAGNLSPLSDPVTVATPLGDPVLVGAGDIATCTGTGDEATANVLDGIPGTVFTLGDNVYPNGAEAEFADCYEPSWGRHKVRTMPAPGNHDYLTPAAVGYFGYFGEAAGDPARGYYAYTRGTWRILVLNSNCSEVGGCGAGSVQELWLRSELAASADMNVLAYWHHPRFSSGAHGSDMTFDAFWQALYDAGADVVLSGHDHTYERFAPQGAAGAIDPLYGIRQFVVGTGGVGLSNFGPPAPNSEVRGAADFGVIELTLRANSYAWRFIHVAGGAFTDAGEAPTHPAPPSDVAPPTTPIGLAATSVSETEVRLAWTPSTDDVLVTGYEVLRNGLSIAFTQPAALVDANVVPGQDYRYQVRARDGAANWSPLSEPLDVTTPSPSESLTVEVSADATVRLDRPSTNYGSAPNLEVDGSPVKAFLLQLDVHGLAGRQVLSATLYLHCIDGSSFGGELHLAPATWSESSVTWDTAPIANPAIVATLGSVSAGLWYAVDVSAVIAGDGTYGLRVVSQATNGADYVSREGSASLRPTLILQLAPP